MIDSIFQNRTFSRLQSRNGIGAAVARAAGRGRPESAGRRGPAARAGSLLAGHSRRPDRAGAQSRRLAGFSSAQPGIRLPDDSRSRHAGGNRHHARKSKPHPVAQSQPRAPDEPVPAARDGLELRHPDHAPSQDRRIAARAVRTQPRALSALRERQRPRPRSRPPPGRARHEPARGYRARDARPAPATGR